MQWYLARQGAEVISVDRISRSALPARFRSRFHVDGLRPEDLNPPARVTQRRGASGPATPPARRSWLGTVKSSLRETLDSLGRPTGSGRVLIYNQDLGNLTDIPDASLDVIVSVSALEHNTQEGLAQVIAELLRTLKPGGALLTTLTAARDQDWWHPESSAWCYTEPTLRKLFDLGPGAPSNYERYDELFAALRGCAELQKELASFYFRSDKNGMPWGVWDPKYQPVGVCKIKQAPRPVTEASQSDGR
jgi:SAM-dependent methyltransferase